MLGKGHNAIYSVSGMDKSHLMYAFDSPYTYLKLHQKNLKESKYQVNNGEISLFRKNPVDFHGTRTVTNGIRVDA